MDLLLKMRNFFSKLFESGLFDNKEKEQSLLLWDLENIPRKRYKEVIKRLGFQPSKTFLTTRRELGLFEQAFIEEQKLNYQRALEDTNADRTLIDYATQMSLYFDRFIFLSSDSDFANIIKILLQLGKKIDLFTIHGANYRILMYLPLNHDNLKIHSLDPYFKTKHKSVQNSTPPTEMVSKIRIIRKRHRLCEVCDREFKYNTTFRLPEICPICRALMQQRFFPLKKFKLSHLEKFKEEYHESMKRFGYYDLTYKKDEPYLVLGDINSAHFNKIDLSRFTAKTK